MVRHQDSRVSSTRFPGYLLNEKRNLDENHRPPEGKVLKHCALYSFNTHKL